VSPLEDDDLNNPLHVARKFGLNGRQYEVLEAIHTHPKTELHIHIEGATSPQTFWELAQRNKVELPYKTLEAWQQAFHFKDFQQFIYTYTQATRCIQYPSDYTTLLIRFHEQQAQANIQHTEAFISASLSVQKFPQQDWLDAIEEGLHEGHKKTGVVVRLIPDLSRELPATQEEVLAFVLKGATQGVFIGLGLGGLETGFPASLFEDLFKEARRAGLYITAHAGEAEGPESMWQALELLGAERLGHGIRVFEDPHLVETLIKRNIPLEVSPTSNYCTGVVAKGIQHPIHRMVEEGLRVVLNTDDPSMFATSLLNESALLMSQGMAGETVLQLVTMAEHVRFAPKPCR
jgi:adenosine deaminase